ncbi:MAG: hypothetical protein ACTSRP_07650 [Candidatus Helarchaeota archaeon]
MFDGSENFKDFILNNRNILSSDKSKRKKFVKIFPYVSEKSISFMLRDISPPLDSPNIIPIPVDVNVCHSIQKTGLLFDSWPPPSNNIIPKKKITSKSNYEIIRNRICSLSRPFEDLCSKCEHKLKCDTESNNFNKCWASRIVDLSRSLFLLGTVYCQKPICLKNSPCPFHNECMLPNLKESEISSFLEIFSGK